MVKGARTNGMVLRLAKWTGIVLLLGGIAYIGLIVAANYGISLTLPRL